MVQDDPKPLATPLAFKPRRSDLEKRIRELAKNDENIIWGEHSLERSDERDITIRDALTVLRAGFLDDDIQPGDNPGEWKGKMTKAMKGRREIGVVVVIIRNECLFAKTVEWEDLR